MEWFWIYLFVQSEVIAEFVGSISGLCMVFGVTGYLCSLGCSAANWSDECRDRRYAREKEPTFSEYIKQGFAGTILNSCKMAVVCGIVMGFLVSLVPSQKNLAIIVGSGVTYQALTSETGVRIGGKAITLLEQEIDKVLEQKDKEEK